MYSTSLRHSASAIQKPPGVATRLLSTTPGRVKIGRAGSFGGVEIPGLPPKKPDSESSKTSTGASGTTPAVSPSPAVVNKTSIHKYARRLDKYKAGQSPATLYPERTRSFQPGLSWLGDDEFESTGLAFRLAHRHMQRTVVSGLTGGSGSSNSLIKNANPGSSPRRNDENTRARVKGSNNVDRKAFQPKEYISRKPQPKRAYATEKTEAPKTVRPGMSTKPTTPHPTPKLSPSPQTPVNPVHIDLKSVDFTSLFGVSPSISAAPSTSTKATLTDDVSRRVQLALEYHGGDYSKLVSGSLVTSQGDPLLYAESAMARRRELGYKRRNGALRIVQGMIGKSQGSQPTA